MDKLMRVLALFEVAGVMCPVTNMFDINGDEIVDYNKIDNVFSVVVFLQDNKWLAIEAASSELKILHS